MSRSMVSVCLPCFPKSVSVTVITEPETPFSLPVPTRVSVSNDAPLRFDSEPESMQVTEVTDSSLNLSFVEWFLYLNFALVPSHSILKLQSERSPCLPLPTAIFRCPSCDHHR